MKTFAKLTLSFALAALCSACVIAPPGTVHVNDSAEFAKVSEQAIATCGAGQVKEVNTKSFSCK